jgi:hypothetical protein
MGTRSRKIFERTARVFCLLEALGRAYGYEKSPLARLIEEILSGRNRVTPYRFPAIPELARWHGAHKGLMPPLWEHTKGRHLLLIGDIEPFGDRRKRATSWSAKWSQLMITEMRSLSDRRNRATCVFLEPKKHFGLYQQIR